MTATTTIAPRTPSVTTGTVLVVDDDDAMRETVVEILSASGIEAEGAASAADARARQDELRPAVALIDQRLPDASGIELGSMLKEHDADVTVALVTGYASLENAIAAVEQFDGFLTKPVPPPELLRVVHAGLESARLRRENRALVAELTRANARLAASVSERTVELSGLRTLTSALAETVGLDEVLDTCVRTARDVTGADGAAIYLGEDVAPQPLPLRARAGDAVLPRELAVGADAPERGTRFERDGVVRLTAGGRQVGALLLHGADHAPPMFVAALAASAAVAIQNAQRFGREREAVERLSELSRMKSTFLATVSHELRTPLTTVVGFAELLGRRFETLSAAQREEMIGHIIEQGGHLRVLINDLLDASRVEFGGLRVTTGDVDVHDVVGRVERSFSDGANPIVVRLDPELPPVVADDGRLQQVMSNLVGNAVKHSPAGAPVEIAGAVDGARVRLEVADHGTGIDPDFLPHIFEPFAQAERPTGRETGLGLGLYIVRGLVEAMGGTIDAHSTPGEGSRFVVRLARAGD